MRIGIYDPYLDDLGGGEKYMITLAEYLSFNHDVTVFWNNEKDLDSVSKRFFLDISKITVRRNIFSPNCSFFKRCLESLRYDILIVLSDGSIPVVFSRKLFIHFQQPFPQKRPSLKDIFKKMRVGVYFCNSIFTKSYIDKEFGINSRVIYPPVDIKHKKCKKENIILHVGRFRTVNNGKDDYKKQGAMLDVFKKIVDKGLRDWKFVLAVGLRESDKVAFDKLKKKASGYPIEFLINLNKKELEKVYFKSKIYWHASGYREDLLGKPQMAEHFGISTVEAMGAGAVPVVISAGGQMEIVEEGKSGYLWNDLEALMKKTKKLTEDNNLLKKLSEGAVERSKKFTKERFYDDVKKLIE